jgi:hypothetical protein
MCQPIHVVCCTQGCAVHCGQPLAIYTTSWTQFSATATVPSKSTHAQWMIWPLMVLSLNPSGKWTTEMSNWTCGLILFDWRSESASTDTFKAMVFFGNRLWMVSSATWLYTHCNPWIPNVIAVKVVLWLSLKLPPTWTMKSHLPMQELAGFWQSPLSSKAMHGRYCFR